MTRVAAAALAFVLLLSGSELLFMDAYAADYFVFVGGQEGHAVINTVTVGDEPLGIAVNPTTNRIYVTNNIDDSVSVINGTDNTVIATVTVGSGPQGIAVNPTTNRIYMTNRFADTVSVINGDTNAVIDTVTVGNQPVSVAVNPTTNRIYTANFAGNTASVISNTYADVLALTDSVSAIQAGSRSISDSAALSDSIAATHSSAPEEEDDDGGSSSGGGGGNRVVIVNPKGDGPFTTVYPESYFSENPLDKIQIRDFEFLNAAGASISQADTGQQVSISAALTNHQEVSQDYAFIVQITNDQDQAVYVGWQQGTIDSGARTGVSTLWTPDAAGSYSAKVFVLDGMGDAPLILSAVAVDNIEVAE